MCIDYASNCCVLHHLCVRESLGASPESELIITEEDETEREKIPWPRAHTCDIYIYIYPPAFADRIGGAHQIDAE